MAWSLMPFPSLIPKLLSVRISVDVKLYPESNSSSTPPLHCPPCSIQRESQGFRVHPRSSPRHTGLLAALEAHRAPPTLEPWHWLFPPPSGLCSNVICSMRSAWPPYLSPSRRSPCPHSQFPIGNTFSQVLCLLFVACLTHNNVTSVRVRVFFLFCSLCIPKAQNRF